MEAIQVFKVHFDYMENNPSNAISEELLGTFISDGELSAMGKANEFLRSITLGQVQIEYDGEVYPYIKHKTIIITGSPKTDDPKTEK